MFARARVHPRFPLPMIERVGYVLGTCAGLVVFLGMRSLGTEGAMRIAIPVGVVAMGLVATGWWQLWRAALMGQPVAR